MSATDGGIISPDIEWTDETIRDYASNIPEGTRVDTDPLEETGIIKATVGVQRAIMSPPDAQLAEKRLTEEKNELLNQDHNEDDLSKLEEQDRQARIAAIELDLESGFVKFAVEAGKKYPELQFQNQLDQSMEESSPKHDPDVDPSNFPKPSDPLGGL